MAQRIVSGKDILLMIDPAGGTNYDTIVCLTSNTIDRTTALVEAASKCGASSSPGAQTVNVTFSGQIVVDPDSGNIAQADLHDLWQSSDTIGWYMGPAVPVAGDVSYTGTGFIASLSDKYDMSGATFDGSIGVSGDVTKTIETGS
jgi:hypothetical protein